MFSVRDFDYTMGMLCYLKEILVIGISANGWISVYRLESKRGNFGAKKAYYSGL